ncbi:hypothetical protein DEJ45_21420 [Streptomyces venezuelae]|uniref:barstar family protein n=1 Tax=Streptomyces venezuelae TaxID=54571 RepID=UPI00123D9322|nr:barstar family protein [Streptomyces venezuelae]QES14694.1 hypothetical protein DEJ45_21420 [Streptomyces venezuelae]
MRRRPLFASLSLIREEDRHVWGTCAEAEGFFGEPECGSYELRGWVPEPVGAAAAGWLGSRIWLVPEDPGADAWLLSDVEAAPVPGGVVVTGGDDYLGPPEEYLGPVRLHDGRRWLGSCREFAAVEPPQWPAPPLVLRGLAPGGELRRVLAEAGGREPALEKAELELRDGRGEVLTDRLFWAVVRGWEASPLGDGLIDLTLDGGFRRPEPLWARGVWERWLAGPPEEIGAWAGLDTRRRGAWHDLVRERAARRVLGDRPAGTAYELDGRHVTDEPGLWLALGEAVNGPGGYFGGDFQALHDCLGGHFGFTAPATLTWRNADVARAHLSRALAPEGEPYDLFAAVVDALEQDGMRVVLA